jgi:hypothetical protein
LITHGGGLRRRRWLVCLALCGDLFPGQARHSLGIFQICAFEIVVRLNFLGRDLVFSALRR